MQTIAWSAYQLSICCEQPMLFNTIHSLTGHKLSYFRKSLYVLRHYPRFSLAPVASSTLWPFRIAFSSRTTPRHVPHHLLVAVENLGRHRFTGFKEAWQSCRSEPFKPAVGLQQVPQKAVAQLADRACPRCRASARSRCNPGGEERQLHFHIGPWAGRGDAVQVDPDTPFQHPFELAIG